MYKDNPEPTNVTLRSLGGEDADAYRRLRLRALSEHPEAFATSFEEEQQRSLEDSLNRLLPNPQQVTHGAFKYDQLIGFVTLIRSEKVKLRHKANLVAMYIIPEERKHGIAKSLLAAALESAKEWGILDISLAVTVGNDKARRLYSEAGFLPYGIEPRSLCIDGIFYDVELMNLRFG